VGVCYLGEWKRLSTLNNAIRNMVARGVLETGDDTQGVQVLGLSLMDGERKDNVERFQNYGFSSMPMNEAEAIVIFPGGDRSAGVIIAMDERGSRMTGLQPGEVAMYNNAGNSVILHTDGSIEITAIEQVQIWAKKLLVDVEEDVTINAKTAVLNTEETVTVNAKGDVTVNTEANAIVAAEGDASVSANSARVDLQGNMAVVSPGGVLFDTPILACTGDIVDNSGTNPRSVAGMRQVYNTHTSYHIDNQGYSGDTDPPYQQM
jgi:phage baseplate assembly protein V